MPHKEVTQNGIKIPSVTQVINVLDKPGLLGWYGKLGNEECNKIKRESAEFGTAVHDLIDQFLSTSKGEIFIPPEEGPELVLKCAANFREWYRTSGLEVLSTEPVDAVISARYNFQGTWDFIGRKDGKILVADWKTSNQLYDTVGLQLAAYAQLFGENNGWSDKDIFAKIPDGLAVRIDKKSAKVYTKTFTGLEFYFETFKHLIHAYEFHTQTGAWDHRE
jgi:hypothetical protein